MVKRIGQTLGNEHGSSMLVVMTVMIILSIIGMGFLSTAVDSTIESKKVDNFERAHYGGESAVYVAIETLKKQVVVYYAQMAAYRSSTSGLADYTALYMNFFSGIRAAAQTAFCEPELTDYQYGDLETSTSFLEPQMLSENCALYTVESIVTEANVSRTVRGTVVITRVDLSPVGTPSLPYFGDEALVAGGTLKTGLNNGYSIYGNARVGALVTNDAKPWQFTAYNEATCVDPTVVESINWNLDFDAILSQMPSVPGYTPSIPLIPNGTVVDTNYVLNNGGVFADPLNLIGQSGASFQVSSIAYPGGVIYSTGNLTVTNGTFSGGGEIFIYCEGDLNISSVSLSNFTVYCGGNLTVNNGSFGSGDIYCAGNVTMYSAGTINCDVYAAGDITIYGGSFGQNMYSGGTFYCGGLGISNGVVYAEEGIYLGYDNRGGTITGVLYTNGDAYYERGVEITGGQLVAKGDIILDPDDSMWTSVRYNADIVNALLDESRLDEVGFIGTSDTGGAVELPAPQIVFGAESIG